MNRTIKEPSTAMLLDAGLPKWAWGEAVMTRVQIQNKTLIEKFTGKTAWEAWTGENPDLTNLRVFGCEAYVLKKPTKKRDWKSKIEKLRLVRFPMETKGYCLLNMKTGEIIIARSVQFNENWKADIKFKKNVAFEGGSLFEEDDTDEDEIEENIENENEKHIQSYEVESEQISDKDSEYSIEYITIKNMKEKCGRTHCSTI
jgi:hypothetical protein